MLLYVIQGSGSVSGAHIRRGAHPPPHRHQPRAPLKLTHSHATGFPWRPCRGSLVGRALRQSPASRRWLDSKASVPFDAWRTRTSLVHLNADHFRFLVFVCRHPRNRGRGLPGEGERTSSSSMMRVYSGPGGEQGGVRQRVAAPGKQSEPQQRIWTSTVSGNAPYLVQRAMELIWTR